LAVLKGRQVPAATGSWWRRWFGRQARQARHRFDDRARHPLRRSDHRRGDEPGAHFRARSGRRCVGFARCSGSDRSWEAAWREGSTTRSCWRRR